MSVGVVHVRHMGVPMFQLVMLVRVRVRLANGIVGRMIMLVVSVVDMRMSVLDSIMHVLVVLGQM